MKRNFLTAASVIITMGIIVIVSCKKEGKNSSSVDANETGKNETKYSSTNSKESHNMGQNCMSCHKQGGAGEGWFNVAGTVYDTALVKALPNATLKLYSGPNGTGSLMYTIPVDGLGNFYTTQAINFGSGLYPAVQGATTTKYMNSLITGGQCNGCHGVSTSKIYTQ
ncbi:MAG: hypothetical protein ABL940_11705 [Bacteroidia bacterium]